MLVVSWKDGRLTATTMKFGTDCPENQAEISKNEVGCISLSNFVVEIALCGNSGHAIFH